jgi:protein TonB
MFDSVLDRGVAPRRRIATGAAVSVLGHAALLSVALVVRPPAPVEEEPKVVFPPVRLFVPDAPKGMPNGGGARAKTAGATRQRREVLAPAAIPKDFPKIDTFAPPDEPIEGKVIGTPADPDEGSGTEEGPLGVPDGDPAGRRGDFRAGSGMTAPVLLDQGRTPTYTPEALEAHVEGSMTVRCLVTLEGRLRECQALNPVPYMERAVVEALMTRRYSPARDHGAPVEVFYTFRVKLEMPR